MFHLHGTFLFTPNVELTGLLPYFKIHSSETTALASDSSKRSAEEEVRRPWVWEKQLSTFTNRKEEKRSKMECSLCFLCLFWFFLTEVQDQKGREPENKHWGSLVQCGGSHIWKIILSSLVTNQRVTFYRQRCFFLVAFGTQRESWERLLLQLCKLYETLNIRGWPSMINNNTKWLNGFYWILS